MRLNHKIKNKRGRDTTVLLLHPSGSRELPAPRLVVWKHLCHEYFHEKEQTQSTDSFLGTLLPVLPAPEEEVALPGAGRAGQRRGIALFTVICLISSKATVPGFHVVSRAQLGWPDCSLSLSRG